MAKRPRIEITTDPERIAELRRDRAERSPADPLERFFRELPDTYSLGETQIAMLKARRGEAVPRLLEVAARAGVKQVEGAAAIVALCALEEPAVLPIARKIVRSRAKNATWRHMLFTPEARFLGTDPEIRRTLLADLDSDDPKVAKQAVQECGILGLPGALEEFSERLGRPGAADAARMAWWIAQGAPTRANLDRIGAAWLDEPAVVGDESAGFLAAVVRLGGEGGPDVRAASIDLLLRWFAEVRDGVRPVDFMTGSMAILDALDALRRAAPGDPRCAAMAADLIRGRHRLVETFLSRALDATAADPPLHRSLALGLMEGPDPSAARAAAKSLGSTFAGAVDDEIVAAIRAARVQHGAAEEFDEALSRIGGATASAAAEAQLDEQSGPARMKVLWRTRGLAAEPALARAAALGVLPAGSDPAAMAEAARAALLENWPDREPEPADVFQRALAQAGALVGFDTEADEIPPPHDALILSLAGATRDAFVVEAARQTWDIPAGVSEEDVMDSGDVVDAYKVEFLHDGRLVAFRARYFGDYYDAEAVADALNAALAESARPERFQAVLTDGQDLELLLATPDAAEALRNEFFLPVVVERPRRRKKPKGS
ncbi:hypothetical protein [Paludisphaera soli]|uniref:hypothetical protein n=1 Tax=Paludisphaera soli TaxID=2712865 RepID=UPI0013EB02B4|nr:hypothetical protein [Paludisphaera soli]